MIRLLLTPLLALSLSVSAASAGDPEVHQAVARFLTAFENLDMPAFMACFADNAAVVTFHLRNAQRIARRTLVLEKVKDRWLIQHLHASNQPLAPS